MSSKQKIPQELRSLQNVLPLPGEQRCRLQSTDHLMGSCTTTAVITGIFAFMAGFASCGAVFLLCKKLFVKKQQPSLSGSDDPDGDQNLDFETKDESLVSVISEETPTSLKARPEVKFKRGDMSQQDQSPYNSRSSSNGTEEVAPHSWYNSSMEQDTSEMKGSDSGSSPARRDKPTGSQKTDRSKTASVSSSSGNALLRRSGLQRSLSYRSNASEEGESLLDKQESHKS